MEYRSVTGKKCLVIFCVYVYVYLYVYVYVYVYVCVYVYVYVYVYAYAYVYVYAYVNIHLINITVIIIFVCLSQVRKPTGSEVEWAECLLIIGTGRRVQVLSLILDSSVGLSAGIQFAGD